MAADAVSPVAKDGSGLRTLVACALTVLAIFLAQRSLAEEGQVAEGAGGACGPAVLQDLSHCVAVAIGIAGRHWSSYRTVNSGGARAAERRWGLMQMGRASALWLYI